MRDIKFRVWNYKENKMHMPFDNCSTTYNLDYYENTKHTKYPMQYTGLNDIHNKEIYDGDILQVHAKPNHFVHCMHNKDEKFCDVLHGYIVEVFYSAPSFAIRLDNGTKEIYHDLGDLISDYEISKGTNKVSAKIIGNIYNDPDLV